MFLTAIITLLCLQCFHSEAQILNLPLRELTELLDASNIPEDGRLRFCELANKYNMDCIRYNVTTEDGYILGLFNIPGDRTRPVFIKHGLAASADVFIVRGNVSWVAFLASKGYDVWLGNTRGNMYSRAHVSLSPDYLKFWDFTFHEMAKYDVPAMTDFILEKTGQKQISSISHSAGTTVFLTMGVLRPEYNDKFKVVILLAPSAYLHNTLESFFPIFRTWGPTLSPIMSLLGHGEIFRNSSALVAFIRLLCVDELHGYTICVESYIFLFMGREPDQFEPEFLSTAIAHYPSGTSVKELIHVFQRAAGKRFAQFDYGYRKNILKYNSTKPPNYDLSKNTMKIAMVLGLNDKFTNPKDIRLLRKQLPNVVEYHAMKLKTWNHVSFVWGKYLGKYLFGYINDLLNKYN